MNGVWSRAIFDRIECSYDPRHRHSSPGYLSPITDEETMTQVAGETAMIAKPAAVP